MIYNNSLYTIGVIDMSYFEVQKEATAKFCIMHSTISAQACLKGNGPIHRIRGQARKSINGFITDGALKITVRALLLLAQISAITSTSTSTPLGRAETATQERAGLDVKYLA